MLLTALALMMSVNQALAQGYEAKTQAQNLMFIADAFDQAGNDEKALQLLSEASRAATSADDKWNVARRQAKIYIDGNEMKRALDVYNFLLVDEEVQTSEVVKMHIYEGLGRIYYTMHDYVHSIRSFEESHRIMTRIHGFDFMPQLYCGMAQTLRVAGDVARAGELIDSAEQACQKNESMRQQLAEIYLVKSEYLAATDRYKQAYAYREQYAEIMNVLGRQRLNEVANSMNPVSIQHKFESEAKYEKEREEYESTIESLKKNSNNNLVAAICGGIIVVMLLLVLAAQFVALRKRKRLMVELRKELEDKQRMMSIIAHDFVNPFNSLIGFSELQMQYLSVHNDRELVEYSRQIYRSAQTLYGFFSNILAWSRQGRHLDVHKERLNVGSEIEDVVEICRLMAEDKGIKVTVSADESLEVEVDRNHFVIMLRNVITNALKFTDHGGRITISAYKYKNKLAVAVEDTGVGMSSATIDAVMNNASVHSTAGTTGEMGVGLGLGVCRDMVRANGGDMEISSIEGQGTTITFTFE